MVIISPQRGFPTSPTPLAFSMVPTFLGFLKWSITVFEYIISPSDDDLIIQWV
jgi:hypothetical protein